MEFIRQLCNSDGVYQAAVQFRWSVSGSCAIQMECIRQLCNSDGVYQAAVQFRWSVSGSCAIQVECIRQLCNSDGVYQAAVQEMKYFNVSGLISVLFQSVGFWCVDYTRCVMLFWKALHHTINVIFLDPKGCGLLGICQ